MSWRSTLECKGFCLPVTCAVVSQVRFVLVLALVLWSMLLPSAALATNQSQSDTGSRNDLLSLPPLPFVATAGVSTSVNVSGTQFVYHFLGLSKSNKDNNSNGQITLIDFGVQYPKFTTSSTDIIAGANNPQTTLVNNTNTEQQKISDQTSEYSDSRTGTLNEQTTVKPRFELNMAVMPQIENDDAPLPQVNTNTAISTQRQTVVAPSISFADQQQVEKDLQTEKARKQTDEFWERLSIVPSKNKFKGRFASAIATIDQQIFILGGYSNNIAARPSLAPNKQNLSDFYVFDTTTRQYTQLADLPVPVDDTVLVTYRDRYLYAISGWHKEGAVNLVQVFDSFKNEWFQASPILGNGVFGHAAGIIDNKILSCDGASMQAQFAAPASVLIKQQCFIGEIDVTNPSKITWQEWVHPGDAGRFRMAAVSDIASSQICFVGGATHMYDLNGIAANNTTVEGTSEVWCYNTDSQSWSVSEAPEASFDHRSAFVYQGHIVTIGGRNKAGMLNKAIWHKKIN